MKDSEGNCASSCEDFSIPAGTTRMETAASLVLPPGSPAYSPSEMLKSCPRFFRMSPIASKTGLTTLVLRSANPLRKLSSSVLTCCLLSSTARRFSSYWRRQQVKTDDDNFLRGFADLR